MREPQLIIATAAKGRGKTYTTCLEIKKYLTPNIAIGKKARKVLIFDVNKEYTNEELTKNGHGFRTKVLALKDVEAWSKQQTIEVRRILPVDANGQEVGTEKYEEILRVILQYFRGGLLVLEDINKYMINTSTSDIIGVLTTNRHRDLDIYVHYQTLSAVTTRMWQNVNVIRLHYQNDPVDRYKHRVTNFELMKIAQLLVNEQVISGDERFYCYVLVQENKIRGKFSQRAYLKACLEYLYINKKEIAMVQSRFGTGKQARKRAIKHCVINLYKKYYGNTQKIKEAA